MCGIVGYVGEQSAVPILMDGLRRLEYRGYDSAGLAEQIDGGLSVYRQVGRVGELGRVVPEESSSTTGIAHTRWATHGGVTEANAHPHLDSAGSIAVVHNGIIDNVAVLRERLQEEGCVFLSETDSEVLPHLIRKHYEGDPLAAVRHALAHVQGTYGIAVIFKDHPGLIIAARLGSPLVIGLGEGETFLASDPHALIKYTRRVIFLEDGEIASITAEAVNTSQLDGGESDSQVEELEAGFGTEDKGEYPHFMLKEIYEQPDSIARCLRGRVQEREGTAKLGGLDLSPRDLACVRRFSLIGCGTSYHAAMLGAMAIEAVARVPASAEIASEFRHRNPVIDPESLSFAISQSGETFDTLGAIKEIQLKGGRVLGVVNSVGSSIARLCGAGVYVHSGPEIAVASTKAFTSQVTALYVFTLMLGRTRTLSHHQGKGFAEGLLSIPEKVKSYLADSGPIQAAVDLLEKASYALFMGRGPSWPVAMEGALKLKELAYIPCEAYPAGEMKHGAIAMLEEGTPVIVICPKDAHRTKTLSNLQEVRARGARVILIHNEGDAEAIALADVAIAVPETDGLLTPLITVLPLQILAYQTALRLGREIDRPRNLAKSVTVE
jgi:glucosamine--fructose-6-phosphate aminotransferase (isomerizing)